MARQVKRNRTIEALALVLIVAAPRPAMASEPSVTTCSMNGRMQGNREFWDRLKHSRAEAARQKAPKTGEDYRIGGADGLEQEQQRKSPKTAEQD